MVGRDVKKGDYYHEVNYGPGMCFLCFTEITLEPTVSFLKIAGFEFTAVQTSIFSVGYRFPENF